MPDDVYADDEDEKTSLRLAILLEIVMREERRAEKSGTGAMVIKMKENGQAERELTNIGRSLVC